MTDSIKRRVIAAGLFTSLGAMALAGCEAPAPTPDPDDKTPGNTAGDESRLSAAEEAEVKQAVNEMAQAVEKRGGPVHRTIRRTASGLDIGEIEDGRTQNMIEKDYVPQGLVWVVDCHDKATGDIISSTDAGNLNDLNIALGNCALAGGFVDLCMMEASYG